MTDRLRPGSTAPSYAHTQRGTVILTALAGGAVVCLAIMLIKDVPGFAPFIVAGIMALDRAVRRGGEAAGAASLVSVW